MRALTLTRSAEFSAQGPRKENFGAMNPGRWKFVHSIGMQRFLAVGLRTAVLRICASAMALATSLGADQTTCPAAVGNPAGNYMVPGSLADARYRARSTLHQYPPAATPPPPATLFQP